MSNQTRRSIWVLTLVVFSASLLTACSGLSMSGGVAGTIVSIVGIFLLLFGFTTTQSGCDVGPCLSIISEPPPDAGIQDTKVGPCLTPLPPDWGAEPTKDAGTGTEKQLEPDVGPCLSPPPPTGMLLPQEEEVIPQMEPGFQTKYAEAAPQETSRASAIEKLQAKGVLPADVVERLKASKGSNKEG
ncbi:MAG: hypothetical protein EP343_25305 [Deltaproteobacteria bacterium]|nr:MAG: hypothetical protein EP343_25305 [Deltaproteobacteria bacterium]